MTFVGVFSVAYKHINGEGVITLFRTNRATIICEYANPKSKIQTQSKVKYQKDSPKVHTSKE